MTQLPAPRTLARIQSDLDMVTKMLTQTEAHMQALRNEPMAESAYLLGFPQYGLYLTGSGSFEGVLRSRLMDAHVAARIDARNIKGERAFVVSYEYALAEALTTAQDAHTVLCRAYRDLLQERVDCEALDLQAAQHAYETAL